MFYIWCILKRVQNRGRKFKSFSIFWFHLKGGAKENVIKNVPLCFSCVSNAASYMLVLLKYLRRVSCIHQKGGGGGGISDFLPYMSFHRGV